MKAILQIISALIITFKEYQRKKRDDGLKEQGRVQERQEQLEAGIDALDKTNKAGDAAVRDYELNGVPNNDPNNRNRHKGDV